MGRVVQKYGGSSVADAESIKRVAKRIVATKQAGNDVVVVISATGDTTDELMDLALQVSPLPPPRELDMLLTAGERMSAALLAMAIHDQGLHARSLTGSQAGIITTGIHGNARIIDITPGRITSALELGDIVICPEHTTDLEEAVVHGVLHLTGMDHETDDGEMLALQGEILGWVR